MCRRTLLIFSLKQILRSSCGVAPYSQRTGTSLFPRWRDPERNPKTQYLQGFPKFSTFSSYAHCPNIFLHHCPFFLKSSLTIIPQGFYLLSKPTMSWNLNRFVGFSQDNISFVCLIFSQEMRRAQENHFSPYSVMYYPRDDRKSCFLDLKGFDTT